MCQFAQQLKSVLSASELPLNPVTHSGKFQELLLNLPYANIYFSE